MSKKENINFLKNKKWQKERIRFLTNFRSLKVDWLSISLMIGCAINLSSILIVRMLMTWIKRIKKDNSGINNSRIDLY